MNSLLNIQKLINDYSLVNRSHYVANSEKSRENDLHHSFSVAILAWHLHDKFDLNLDMQKVLKYSLIHDLVEIYAGDVNSYASEQHRQQKKAAEDKALLKIEQEFKDEFPSLVKLIRDYETRQDDESQFVWSVDKIQAVIHGKLDNYRPFYEQGISRAEVERVEKAKLLKIYAPLKKYYQGLVTDFLEGYSDEAVETNGQIISLNCAPRELD